MEREPGSQARLLEGERALGSSSRGLQGSHHSHPSCRRELCSEGGLAWGCGAAGCSHSQGLLPTFSAVPGQPQLWWDTM